MFQGNMSPPSYGSKNKLSKKTACYLLHAGFLLGLCFDPEDGGDMFLWNVCWLSMDYAVLYTRRQNYSILRKCDNNGRNRNNNIFQRNYTTDQHIIPFAANPIHLMDVATMYTNVIFSYRCHPKTNKLSSVSKIERIKTYSDCQLIFTCTLHFPFQM
jgi:hypothetical protein